VHPDFQQLAGPPWADLVFHVLAHVGATAELPASLYDQRYVAYCEKRLGAAAQRSLGQDSVLLGQIAPRHEDLARIQLVAWLFRDLDGAAARAGAALSDLGPDDVLDPALLAGVDPAAELLWCAALLELEAFRALPPALGVAHELTGALARATAVAPGISECRIETVRSLCRRGRVRKSTIWIGLPDLELGVSTSHLIWQASHEATVRELAERVRSLPAEARPAERAIEHAAVVQLAERARAAGLSAEHAAWMAHFGENAPPLARASLPESARRLLDDD
jgi:hypothetical protein